jgi:hypothetical protein
MKLVLAAENLKLDVLKIKTETKFFFLYCRAVTDNNLHHSNLLYHL